MEQEVKILIPLIGVLLGWFLSSMTNLFKIRGDKRKILGISIEQLYYLIHELTIAFYYIEKVKDKLPIEKWEEHRQYAINRFTSKNEESHSQLNKLIENISSISPTLGIELKKLIETYFFNRKAKFDSTKSNKDVYLMLLSALEVSQDITTKELEKILIKLSFKYSFILGLQIKWKLQKGKANLEKGGDQIYEKFSGLINV